MKKVLLISIFLVVIVLSSGCLFYEKEPVTEDDAKFIIGYVSLINHLKSEDIEIKTLGISRQPFFSVKSMNLTLNGELVYVFDYSNVTAARNDMALVSPDAQFINNTRMRWTGTPHFFNSEEIIVLYIGDNRKIITALESGMGVQFAPQSAKIE
ncbi:MAG: hypothetical protein SCH39_03645 [Methanosarcinales archaeon]|nr:hypothetical protein [ANME-2 cluster archaeon]MDW7775416.1 hypothetical protein [Methanosarcinales archaeon]